MQHMFATFSFYTTFSSFEADNNVHLMTWCYQYLRTCLRQRQKKPIKKQANHQKVIMLFLSNMKRGTKGAAV